MITTAVFKQSLQIMSKIYLAKDSLVINGYKEVILVVEALKNLKFDAYLSKVPFGG